jgi:hypothetical protein
MGLRPKRPGRTADPAAGTSGTSQEVVGLHQLTKHYGTPWCRRLPAGVRLPDPAAHRDVFDPDGTTG